MRAGTLPRSMGASAVLVGVATLAGPGLMPLPTAAAVYGLALALGAVLCASQSKRRHVLLEAAERFDARGGRWIVWGIVLIGVGAALGRLTGPGPENVWLEAAYATMQTCAVLAPGLAGFADGCILGSRFRPRLRQTGMQRTASDHRDMAGLRSIFAVWFCLGGAALTLPEFRGWSLVCAMGLSYLAGFALCRALQKIRQGPWRMDPGAPSDRKWEAASVFGVAGGMCLVVVALVLETGGDLAAGVPLQLADQGVVDLVSLESLSMAGVATVAVYVGALSLGMRDGCMTMASGEAFGRRTLPGDRGEASGAVLSRAAVVGGVIVSAVAALAGMEAASFALLLTGAGTALWLIGRRSNFLRGSLACGYLFAVATCSTLTLVLVACIVKQVSLEAGLDNLRTVGLVWIAAVLAAYIAIAGMGVLLGRAMHMLGRHPPELAWRGYARLLAALPLAGLLYAVLVLDLRAGGEGVASASADWWFPLVAVSCLAPAFLALTAFCDGVWLAASHHVGENRPEGALAAGEGRWR